MKTPEYSITQYAFRVVYFLTEFCKVTEIVSQWNLIATMSEKITLKLRNYEIYGNQKTK